MLKQRKFYSGFLLVAFLIASATFTSCNNDSEKTTDTTVTDSVVVIKEDSIVVPVPPDSNKMINGMDAGDNKPVVPGH